MSHELSMIPIGRSIVRWCAVVVFLFSALSPSGAQSTDAPALLEPDWALVSAVAAPPALTARAAMLVEVRSRTVLYARNPHLVIPPASLTKLVSIDAALRAVAMGEVDPDARFSPPVESWAENQPPGSSLMFLGSGQELTLRELLLGLSVSSGNDAAVALALLLDEGVPEFARRMNSNARDLGLVDLRFVEPSGISPHNSMTAHAFMRFILAHVESFPEALDELYSVRRFTYPSADNRVSDAARQPITQSNRNVLLWEFDGVDGLKTGFIDESGYHLAATAERDGRRLVALVLGIDAGSHAVGGAVRAAEASALLEYGFEHFEVLRVGYPEPSPVRVFRGERSSVTPDGPRELVVSVPSGALERITGTIDQLHEVVAPTPSAEVGTVSIELDGAVLASEALVLPEQSLGSVGRRLWDGIRLLTRRIGSWVGDADLPVSGDELVRRTR